MRKQKNTLLSLMIIGMIVTFVALVVGLASLFKVENASAGFESFFSICVFGGAVNQKISLVVIFGLLLTTLVSVVWLIVSIAKKQATGFVTSLFNFCFGVATLIYFTILATVKYDSYLVFGMFLLSLVGMLILLIAFIYDMYFLFSVMAPKEPEPMVFEEVSLQSEIIPEAKEPELVFPRILDPNFVPPVHEKKVEIEEEPVIEEPVVEEAPVEEKKNIFEYDPNDIPPILKKPTLKKVVKEEPKVEDKPAPEVKKSSTFKYNEKDLPRCLDPKFVPASERRAKAAEEAYIKHMEKLVALREQEYEESLPKCVRPQGKKK